MKLLIDFPDTLSTEMLLEQKQIPCFCKVSSDFSVSFEHLFPNRIEGQIQNWDIEKISNRAPAGAGGEYLYFQHALITLQKLNKSSYNVIELKFFCEGIGWCSIISEGSYGPVGDFWDSDEP